MALSQESCKRIKERLSEGSHEGMKEAATLLPVDFSPSRFWYTVNAQIGLRLLFSKKPFPEADKDILREIGKEFEEIRAQYVRITESEPKLAEALGVRIDDS